MSEPVKAPAVRLYGTVLDCLDAKSLARFYERLLVWRLTMDELDWCSLREPNGTGRISFQSEPDYVPPVWPPEAGKQQHSMHLDFEVDDLEAACAYALSCGATLSPEQLLDDVRVFFDPSGHPFCFFVVTW